MRTFVLLSCLGIALGSLALESTVSAQQIVSSQPSAVVPYRSSSTGYVCPKCGKVHSHAASVSSSLNSSPIQHVSYHTPVPQGQVSFGSRLRATGGITNVLASINAQRSRQGIGRLQYDPQLQAVAQRRAQKMASMGLKRHPPGSFSPGRYEGVGWSSSYSPNGVSACYTSDPGMRYAGAAMATGRDGVYFAVVYR